MDCVLVDAPCTGTGTWRRRPDSKWRLDERNLATRIGEQDGVLAGAAKYVKPGGRLVYVTCSLLPSENADRIDAFLKTHPAFVPAGLALGNLCNWALSPAPGTANVLLTPHSTDTDGFFVAAMMRTAA
jgi:16S rRNA (cytosine967-C5)-methyltransferase